MYPLTRSDDNGVQLMDRLVEYNIVADGLSGGEDAKKIYKR